MLKTTLIGHASLLIQSKETTILTDPVWFDYLWEEINVLCPRTELDKDTIPPVDVLFLSHRHQDHFDVRTLAYLKRNNRILKPDARIMAPNDDILLEVLKEPLPEEATFMEKLDRLDAAAGASSSTRSSAPESIEGRRAQTDLDFIRWKQEFVEKLPEGRRQAYLKGRV